MFKPTYLSYLLSSPPPPLTDRVESLMLDAYRCLSQLELQDMAAQCLERLCKYYVEMDRTKVCVPRQGTSDVACTMPCWM